jgi:DNA gyrase inhibitor GyrI
MSLNETPHTVQWPETHYIFIEKIGPFMQTAHVAWGEVHKLVPAVSEHNQITGYMSLYKAAPEIYRAGVALAALPIQLPDGLRYEKFPGGKYTGFTLTGPYSQLAQASCRASELAGQFPLRDDFNIESYVTDPRTTPEDQLLTKILFPTA